ncbi:phosphonate ABC transporter, permease protein PhnE [bacterium]|nr:MAG: phosphonate ABC transporter, permease protein PhnE [bacterium]
MKASNASKIQRIVYSALFAAVLLWSFTGLDISPERLIRGIPQLWGTLLAMFAHPDWSYAPDVMTGLRESVQIAVIGTLIGSVLALPFGAIAATNITPFRFISSGGKLVLGAVRTFPELVLALVFIKALGPGAFAGALAVGFHSIGTMGKLYAERIEATEEGAIEALRATGASPLQVFCHAIWPDITPDLLSFALYRLDINVRAATILGIVGAGGVGTLLQFQIGKDWPKVGLILLGIIVTVGCIDAISSRLRAKLV